jgi:large subunit ribosomal protein L14
MIHKGTKIQIADNSGAQTVRCFQLARYSKKKYSKLGQIIFGSVIKYKFNRKVIKKQMCSILMTTTKKNSRYKQGIFLKFDVNQGVLVTKEKKLLGSRIFGPFVANDITKNLKVRLSGKSKLI